MSVRFGAMVTLRNSISILTSLKATLKIILVIRTENGSDDLKKLVWQVLTILVKLKGTK
jgi:hypothetical protein